MKFYETINLPIALGKKELSPESAYFLGAIFSANESFLHNGKRYWLAPVRHNYGQVTDAEINEHMQILQQIIGRANGIIMTRDEMKANKWFGSESIMRAFATKQGFAAVFESEESTTIDSFFSDVRLAMSKSPKEVIQAFVAGAFDGRFSKDGELRYLSLDCENPNVANYLRALLDGTGIKCNYNTARERLEGGRPRKNQLRIKRASIPVFMEKVGIVSPFKFELIRSMLAPNLFTHIDNGVLWGLKTLSTEPQEGNVFDYLTPEEQEIEDVFDTQLVNGITEYIANGDTSFTYSGTPKIKSELLEMKGRQTYRRDRSVSANALLLAEYKCEIDKQHPSFVRKNSHLLYSEPHHLVPVSFHKMFPVSLDIEENIVSLCSNCHNQLHYGKEIKPLLAKLYDERKDLLSLVGVDISLQELYKMYNA